ncbi:PAS domain S-box protein [Longimicrobium sp.]|uniref:PAS domain S-box protein n=1 Tax=Longimicrobium sp. TaxID=2029185 RepID=UPI002BFCBE3D|nr:PAS domain S-box protein [Longimicrobium sp.]HSU14239.1 PAS domain S-box protein [Longimicrobium sp.]
MTDLAAAAPASALSLLAASPDGVLAYDRDFRVTFWNGAMERLFGVPAAEMLGRDAHEVFPFLRDLNEREIARTALRGETAAAPEWEITLPATGTGVRIEARYAPLRDEAGEVCGVMATVRKVEARRRTDDAEAGSIPTRPSAEAETALRRSEERYRSLVEAWTQMVWTTDPRGMVVDMPFWRHLTGQTVEEVRGDGWLSAIHPGDRERVLAVWWSAVEARSVYEAEYRLRLRDGSYRWFVARGVPVLEADGSIREWVGVFNDVHDRRVAEAALRDSEERYRLATLATRDVVWDWDLATDEVRFGDSIRQVLGFHPGDVAPEANWWYDHIHPHDRDRVVAGVHDAIRRRAEVWTDSYRHLRADGQWAQVEDRAFLLYGDDGRPVRMVGATQDVTERRRAEAVREAERLRLRRVLSRMPAAVSVHEGPELTFVALSEAMQRQIGGRPVLGLSAREALPELAAQGFVDELERVYATGEPFTARAVSAWYDSDGDGVAEEHVMDYAYEPLLDAEGGVYGVVSHVADVTGREQAARELAEARREAEWRADESARLARELAEKAAALQERADEAHRLAVELGLANLELRAASARAEEAGRRIAVLAEASSRLAASLDYRETVRTVADLAVPALADWCFVEMREEGGPIRLLACGHRDPELVELVAETLRRNPIDIDAPHGTGKVLRTGEPEVVLDIPPEFVELMGKDDAHRDLLRRVGFRSYVSVPLAVAGRTFGVLSLVHSDSGRRFGADDVDLAAELAHRAAVAIENARLYEEALAANQAKAGFLATMSHELRTPLNAMIGYVDLLLMGIPDPIPVSAQGQVERIRLASRHLLSIIEEILTFSRIEAGRETPEMEDVDLASVANEVSAIIEPLAREKGLLFHLPDEIDPPMLRTDPRKLRQILVNLLGNAVKFTARGSVGFAVERGDGEVLLHVRDTGLGIAPEFHEIVFEPFRQVDDAKTRAAAGTGLGLTVSRELARLLGGDVTLASTLGEGSVFTVRLPEGERG